MKTAYLYQAVNLAVGVLMLPLLLQFLSPGQFLQWTLFTMIGGLTLQVESAVQTIAVRHIGRQIHGGGAVRLERAFAHTRASYAALALFALVVMALGAAYLSSADGDQFDRHWPAQWGLFAAAYVFNYLCGPNNAVLIAAERISALSTVNTASRLLNFALLAALLTTGWGITGLCISFAISVAAGCGVNLALARVTRKRLRLGAAGLESASHEDLVPDIWDFVRYLAFVILSYTLYRVGLLVITTQGVSPDQAASYALALQLMFLLVSVALVPIQMRVAPMIRALSVGRDAAGVEFARLHLLVNICFAAGIFGMVIAGPWLLTLIGSRVALPSAGLILLLGAAFVVEVNILCVANIFLIRNRYDFTKRYVASAIFAGGLAVLAWILTHDLAVAFVAVPLCVQMTMALGFFARSLRGEVSLSLSTYRAAIRRPI